MARTQRWSGTVPLVLMTVAIAVSVWQPIVSLALTAVLLIGQFFYVIPAMYANHWAIYIGSFIALAFILWTAAKRTAVSGRFGQRGLHRGHDLPDDLLAVQLRGGLVLSACTAVTEWPCRSTAGSSSPS